MSVLTANLKFFYQRPMLVGLILIPGCIFAFFLPLAFMEGPKQEVFNFVVWEVGVGVYFGVLCASAWKEVLGKPLSYCLPGGHEVPRKVLLTAGVGINILIAIFILFIHAISGSRSVVPVPLHAPPRPIPHVGKQSVAPGLETQIASSKAPPNEPEKTRLSEYAKPCHPEVHFENRPGSRDFGRPKSPERLDMIKGISLFFSVFFAGFCGYLASVLLVFRLRNSGFVLFGSIPLFYLFLLSPKTFRGIENLILSHPLTMAVLGIGLGFFAWSWLGRRTLAQTLCQNPSLCLMDTWNQAKMKKFTNMALALQCRPQDELRREKRENFFLARMKHYDVLSVGRNVWGNLYRFWGPPSLRLAYTVLLGLFPVIFCAFCVGKDAQWFLFVFPAIMAGTAFPLPLKQSMLLPAGRKEQGRAVMVLVLAYTLLVMAVLVVLGVFWHGLYLLIPQVTVAGRTFTCNPFYWTSFYTLPLLLPFCFIIRRFFTRYVILASIVLAWICIPAGFFLFPWLAAKGILTIIIPAGVLWVLCFLAYQDYFRRANLAGQGRN